MQKERERNCEEINVVTILRIGPSLFSKFDRYLRLLAIGTLAKTIFR